LSRQGCYLVTNQGQTTGIKNATEFNEVFSGSIPDVLCCYAVRRIADKNSGRMLIYSATVQSAAAIIIVEDYS
jgi:hypothetical protein